MMKSYSKIYYDIAMEYQAGRNGKPKDYKKAFDYLQRSIQEEKTKDNLYQMGWSYLCGFGIEVDELKAHQMFLEAAELGDGMAQSIVGMDFYHGRIVYRDPRRAAYYLALAMHNPEFDDELISFLADDAWDKIKELAEEITLH
jgi:TPR repeat protein